jgi:hypothetical protein
VTQVVRVVRESEELNAEKEEMSVSDHEMGWQKSGLI